MFSVVDSKNKLKDSLKKQQKKSKSDENLNFVKDKSMNEETASMEKENYEPEKDETEKKKSSKEKKKKQKENAEIQDEDVNESLSKSLSRKSTVKKDKHLSFLPSLKISKLSKLSKSSLNGESSTKRNGLEEAVDRDFVSNESDKEDQVEDKTPKNTKRLQSERNREDTKFEKCDEEIDDESEVGSEDQDIIDEDRMKIRKKRRKRKKKSKKKLKKKEDLQIKEDFQKKEDLQKKEILQEIDPKVEDMINESKSFEEDYLFAVIIHGSEHLNKDLKFLSHPLVRITIVDPSTGRYIRKTNSSASPTYDETDYIMPVLTRAFDFKTNNSLLPRWEETLIFNQSIKDLLTAGFTTQDQIWSPIVFFVIRDFKSMMKCKNDAIKIEDERGWHNCAWAFLKLVGQNGESNIDKQCRLQLYKPPKKFQFIKSGQNENSELIDPVFNWWLSGREPYNSTLFISIKPLKSIQTEIESSSLHPLQLEEEVDFDPSHKTKALQQIRPLPTWSKLPNQDFKVPNSMMLRLWAGSHGAFTIKFSNKGYLLAVACRHGETFPILIYSIPYGELSGELCGHQQLVYDIDWSLNDQLLLSASGDGTAQVWSMTNTEEPAYTLSHPAYVYTAKFHPVVQHVVATAGFDKIIRVWSILKKKSQLLQELEGHKSLINTLTFEKTGLIFYTGDDDGAILCWNSPTSENPEFDLQINWSLKKRIDDGKLKSFGINRIEINPKNQNKLLVCCKNTDNKMFDVRIQSLQSYHGVPNKSHLIGATLTPCGSFIFAANVNGCCYVWNTETGDQVAMYDQLGYQSYVRDITYHTHDHMVAVCSFDLNSSVLVYRYDVKVALKGIKMGNFVGEKEEVNLSSNQPDEINLSKLDLMKKQLDSYVLGSSASKPLLPASKLIRDERKSDLLFRSPKSNLSKFQPLHTSIEVNEDLKNPIFISDDEEKKSLMTSEICKSLKMSAKQATNQYVLVLFDYKSNRADELTVHRDDVIKVIFKDGDEWWFGEKSDGNQGYFPTSCVTTNDKKDEDCSVVVDKELKIEDLKSPKRLDVAEDLFSSRGRRRANRIKKESSFTKQRPLPPLLKPKALKRKSKSPKKDSKLKENLSEESERKLSSADEPRKKHKIQQDLQTSQFGILKAIQQKLRESNHSCVPSTSSNSDTKRRTKRRHRQRENNDVTTTSDAGIQNEAFEE